jgi:cobalt-zinc-cadmium efflux system protein
MGHNHSHIHDQGTGNTNERRLFWAGLLTAGTMLAEAIGGIYAGSLALVADAGHMLTDAAALGLAWLAVRMAARPADWKRTYGFQRFEVLAAFANGLALFFISAAIAWEAVARIFMPVEVRGGTMLIIATLGFLVNLGTLLVLRNGVGALRDGGGANLNVRAALLHVMSDLLGSGAAILAAFVIIWTRWTPIDPLLSILIALLILRSAWLITKDAGHILLEGAPTGLDVREVQRDLEATIPEVLSIHDVHAWCLNEERPLMTLHARITQAAPPEEIAAAIKARLKQCYGIVHATIEIEHRSCSNAGAAAACGEVLKKSM